MSKLPVALVTWRDRGQPVFVPLALALPGIRRMFVLDPKFVVVSDNEVAKEILLTQATSFSRSFIRDFGVCHGHGLILEW